MPEILAQIATLSQDWFPKAFQNSPISPLISKMLSIDPKKRPTAIEAYEEFERLIADL